MASPPLRPEGHAGEDRLREWMTEYGPPLRRYFRRSVSAEEAEDLVQEVFLALQVRGGHGEVENATGYLFRIAANLLAKRREREPWHWDRHATLDGTHEPHEEISPERSLIAKQTVARILVTLKALPPRTAEAFLLHRFEEMTYAAIAKRMGISVKAVEALIKRAMKRVGAALEETA
jgi:RNA polymerase sigma-70 factor (ECF subfamily)